MSHPCLEEPDGRRSTYVPWLPARGHPVSGRPRREQFARVVPAAKARVRAPPEGADGAALHRAQRAVSVERRPTVREPGEVAIPYLPRRSLLQGQAALQD